MIPVSSRPAGRRSPRPSLPRVVDVCRECGRGDRAGRFQAV